MKDINAAIKIRYALESQEETNLSCGNNLAHANLKSGDFVLDLGCGHGRETLAAAQAVSPLGKAVGLDITEEMLASAKKSLEEKNIANVDFVLGNIENLPFKNEVFDVVISNCVINHAKNKKQVFDEIFRVLKQKGRLVISDIVALKELPEHIRNDERAWANCFAGAEEKNTYFNIIAQAGFTSIEILKWREYLKEGYPIASVTFRAYKSE